MDLNTLWFILIAVLFIGYFALDGFDLGVGILLPFLGKSDLRRRVMLNTIGPHWDANEVWLITAGGAMFAAFPGWYATLFSGFYLPLFLILIALILRGIAIEFRQLDDAPLWRSFWTWAFAIGSFVAALLFGVAFANFVRGVPIDATGNYVGGFWNLLNPYALSGGLMSLFGFTLYGAIYLTLKTTDDLRASARQAAARVWIPAVLASILYTILSYTQTDLLTKLGVNPGVVPITAVIAVLAAGYFVRQERDGWAFLMTALAIVFAVTTIFLQLFPRVLVSSLGAANDLTIYNTSSSPYTLQTMSIIALIFVPIVIAYQAWSYWTFHHRVREKAEGLHY